MSLIVCLQNKARKRRCGRFAYAQYLAMFALQQININVLLYPSLKCRLFFSRERKRERHNSRRIAGIHHTMHNRLVAASRSFWFMHVSFHYSWFALTSVRVFSKDTISNYSKSSLDKDLLLTPNVRYLRITAISQHCILQKHDQDHKIEAKCGTEKSNDVLQNRPFSHFCTEKKPNLFHARSLPQAFRPVSSQISDSHRTKRNNRKAAQPKHKDEAYSHHVYDCRDGNDGTCLCILSCGKANQ